MIIAIDATCIGSQLGGEETATRAFLRGLAAVIGEPDHVLVLAASGGELPTEVDDHPGFTVDRVVRRPGSVHFSYTVPRWLAGLVRRGVRPDVVMSMIHAPLWSPAPVALLVPDLSFVHHPGTYPRSTRMRLRTLIGRQVNTASAVLTVSDFSRLDLLHHYRLPAEKVRAIPLTIEPPEAVDPAVRAGLTARGVRPPFLLYLGNLHPRKNVPLAIRAFRAVRDGEPRLAGHQFVVAGRRWFRSDAEDLAAAGAEPGTIRFLDRVSPSEREVLLRDAEALVYLSTFEGFGLPPLEAMARETVVLASNATAIPEVCGGAALMVDPGQPEQVHDGIRRVLLEESLRAELLRRGRERVATFVPERTGRALFAALAQAAGSPRSSRLVRDQAS